MTRPDCVRGSLFLLALGSALLLGVPCSDADVITCTAATGTAASYGSPTNLINGSGLTGVGDILTQTHQSTHTMGWLIDNVNPANDPIVAVDAFLKAHPEFVQDHDRERLLLSYYRGGFLKRVK